MRGVSRSHSLLEDTSFKAMTCGDVCGAHPYIHIYVATVVIQLHRLLTKPRCMAGRLGDIPLCSPSRTRRRTITPFSASVDSLGTTRVV